METQYWTEDGPLDLDVQDPPRHGADMEQWHVSCHVRARGGAELSMFAMFQRMAFADPAGGRRTFAHAVSWAVSGPLTDEYHPVSMVDRAVVDCLRRRLDDEADTRLGRALAEVLERGQIPLPDLLMTTAPVVDADGLHLSFDGCDLVRRDGRYDVTLVSPRGHVACDLRLHPRRTAVRHRTDGVVTVGDHERLHHSFLPGCAVSGRVELPGGRAFEIVDGTGWFDHQVSALTDGWPPDGHGHPRQEQPPDEPRPKVWTWANIELADGRAVSAYEIVDPSTRSTLDSNVVVAGIDGSTGAAVPVEFATRASWISPRTFRAYSTAYRLISKELDVDLDLDARSPDQEFLTTLSPPSFWAGPCTVQGTIEGAPVSGLAHVIQRRVDAIEDVDTLFRRVGDIVIAAVEDVLPHRPTGEVLQNLVGATSAGRLAGIDGDLVGAGIATPIRAIVDRGGKAWRSYVLLAFCEAVGGDARGLQNMLAVPEIVHAGSLIIDDIEDDSTTRRGGPACHVEFGQAQAINAGNAAYFIALATLLSGEHVKRRPDRVKLQLHEIYLRAMRGAHVGQAMDLLGVQDLVSSAVATGDTRRLEERILACYRLKTGVPAACFAAMGAVLGDGTERQVEAATHFMEEAGVAFQILDDVRDLMGSDHDRTKTVGKDVVNGTITLPLVRAIQGSDPQGREALWSKYQAAHNDPGLVPAVVDMLDQTGSIRACWEMAHEVMEQGWADLERELEPSYATVMLRAFSWFVLEPTPQLRELQREDPSG